MKYNPQRLLRLQQSQQQGPMFHVKHRALLHCYSGRRSIAAPRAANFWSIWR